MRDPLAVRLKLRRTDSRNWRLRAPGTGGLSEAPPSPIYCCRASCNWSTRTGASGEGHCIAGEDGRRLYRQRLPAVSSLTRCSFVYEPQGLGGTWRFAPVTGECTRFRITILQAEEPRGPPRLKVARLSRGVDITIVKTTTRQLADRVAIVLGPVLAIVVAWVSSTVSGDVSIANAALVLAFVCIAAALVSPIAGFVTSAVAALALNYFHTTPVHSLRMTEADEIVTVILLVLLGSSVSIATTLRVRTKVAVHRTDESLAATRDLQELLLHGGALPAVWLTAVQSVCFQAGSIDVSLLSEPPGEVPVISHRLPSGPGSDGDAVVIPETGAALLLPNSRGTLLLTPQAGLGAITAGRRMLLQFGDQLAAALDDADQKRSAA